MPVRLSICKDKGSTPWSSTSEFRLDPDERAGNWRSSSVDCLFVDIKGEADSGLGAVVEGETVS